MRRLKLAEIRKNEEDPCPLGLPIPFGCKCAGSHVEKMSPVNILGTDASEEEKQAIGAANTKLLAWNLLRSTEQPVQCQYVGHLMEKMNTVECNFDDSAPGQGSGQALLTAPFYSKMFNAGVGLYSYPIGYYSDYNISKNTYFGTYSLQGKIIIDLISKIGRIEASQKRLKTGKTSNTLE